MAVQDVLAERFSEDVADEARGVVRHAVDEVIIQRFVRAEEIRIEDVERSKGPYRLFLSLCAAVVIMGILDGRCSSADAVAEAVDEDVTVKVHPVSR